MQCLGGFSGYISARPRRYRNSLTQVISILCFPDRVSGQSCKRKLRCPSSQQSSPQIPHFSDVSGAEVSNRYLLNVDFPEKNTGTPTQSLILPLSEDSMRQKHIMPVAAVLMIFLIGCGGPAVDIAWQEARPLGRDLTTYQAPREPPEAEEPVQFEEPTGVITLRQALALVLMHNPDLKAFSWDVRAGEAKTLQARLRPNPGLEAESENFAGSGNLSGFGAIETTVQLSYLIELGEVRGRRKQVAALETDLAGWDYETARLDILTQTAQAFINVLAAQEVVALNEELVRLAEQVLNTVKAQVEAGKVSPVEGTRTQVEIANSRIALEGSKRGLEVACFALASTWGSTSPAFEKVEGQFEMTKPIPTAEQLANRISQNSDIARWTVEMAQRRAAIKLEKSERIPDLSVGGGMKHFNKISDVALIFGLSFPLPLFDRNQGAIREAQYNLAKAFEERKSAEVAAHTALSEAYGVLSAAWATVIALKNDVLPAAQSVFDAATEGYRLGKFGILDLLDAQRTLFENRLQYLEALAAYHKAKASVERLIGEPLF
ncbi:MAG: transporter [Psychrobacter sp.]|nr:transporter [Psychrobacter sp.]